MEVRDAHALLGRSAYAVDGERLGTISGAYLDDATGRPSWVTVDRGGLFRTTRNFVPLHGAEIVDGGIRAGVAADAVRGAPHVDEGGVLSRDDERQLLRHYGLDRPEQDAATEHDVPADGVPGGDVPRDAVRDDTVPDDDAADAMTRSEERARIGTTTVATSRAVLRRTRVVEDRTFSVPLGRDEVEVVEEPLPEPEPERGSLEPRVAPAVPSGRDGREGPDGPDADDEGWVVLYEERLVVRTEWVPVERVRLRTEGVRGEELVQVDLRRERIDVEVQRTGDAPPVDAAGSGAGSGSGSDGPARP